jgi:SAM-dependent methyltransferase
VSNDDGYLLDNEQDEGGKRLKAIGELFDPVTFRHLEAVGITEGWSCWEVGAGGPSVPNWLASRVGASGRVLATDLDTRWLGGRVDSGVEVLHHDVALDEPPEGPFDLVHARLVLVHLTDRAAVLHRLIRALRPGGHLVIEDADPALQPLSAPDEIGPAERLANHLRVGFRTLLEQRGADLAYGRTLPRRLREAGLENVEADAFFPITSPPCRVLEAATVHQVREQMIAQGLATEQEIEEHLTNVAAGQLDLATGPMITAWGRRAR